MRFQLEATPEELEQKSFDLIRQLSGVLSPVVPDLAEHLEKALPRKEQALKYPVLRALQKQTKEIYADHLQRMQAEIAEVLQESAETTHLKKGLEEEVELPASFAEFFFASMDWDDLGKARTHKYIRRVPYLSGGKRKYRYYYTVTGGKGLGHAEEIQVKAKFRVETEDAEGHLTVLAVKGDKVTVEHDETGDVHVFDKKALQRFLHAQHKKAIDRKRKKLKELTSAAEKFGTEKQKQILKERAKKFEEQFKPPEPMGLMPFQAKEEEVNEAVEKLKEPVEPAKETVKPKPKEKNLAKLKPDEIPEMRYEDDEAIEKLMVMGDALYAAQKGREFERDGIGFNSADMMVWNRATGNLDWMRSILRGYKLQLTAAFGLDYYHCGLSDPPKASSLGFSWNSTMGSLQIQLDGRLSGKDFDEFRSINRRHNVWFSRGVNFVHKKNLADFDFAEYRADMMELGLDIPNELPEKPKPKKVEIPKDAWEVKKLIAKRQVHNVISVVQHKDGRFAFYAPYDKEFNKIFRNDSGVLSGITEYNENDHGRETYDLDLVEEAIDKIKARMPGWEIVTTGIKEARVKEDQRQVELQKPIPEVQEKLAPKIKLHAYQNEGVRFLDETGGNALIGDEMGLGKTLQTLAWAAKNNKKILVVCPKVVRRNWIHEAEKFFPDHFVGTELDTSMLRKKKKLDLSDSNIVTVNFEALHKFKDQIEAAGFDTIVIDESHKIKNPKAKRTKTIQEVAKKMKHKILLSGTAILNNRQELVTQVDLIAPDEYTEIKRKVDKFGGVHYKRELKNETIGGAWNELRPIYLVRKKKDVLPDLPEKTTTILELETKGLPDLPAKKAKIGDFSRVRTELAVGKAEATKEVIKEVLDSSQSRMLVFTESLEAAKKLAAEFGDLAVLHHGQQSHEKREAAKKEFQKQDESGEFISEKRIFVTTRQAMEVGANLTAADKVIFNDLPWNPGLLDQAESRAQRIGQKKNVNVYWVTAANNLFDQHVTAIIRRKFELAKKVNHGEQVTPEEREWMQTALTEQELLDQIRGLEAGPEKFESSEETAKSFAEFVQLGNSFPASPEEKNELTRKSLLAVSKGDSWSKAEKKDYYDHTKPVADHDDIAYRRVKEVLKRKGYVDSDFEDGGPLYGYSTNQLLKLIRGSDG